MVETSRIAPSLSVLYMHYDNGPHVGKMYRQYCAVHAKLYIADKELLFMFTRGRLVPMYIPEARPWQGIPFRRR